MAFNDEPVQFKFKWLNEQGQETGFLRKRGELKDGLLLLDKTEVPLAALAQIAIRENRMGIAVMTESGVAEQIAISVSGGISAKNLKKRIDIIRSVTWAQVHRKALEEKGEGHRYRDETCPACQATLLLSGMPETPQLYCHFCESLMTLGEPKAAPAGERDLKLCDSCGMFSKPRKFTIFYFYFLLVIYGWRQQTTWRCPACARGDSWKMLFGNLIFILGVPVAIIQLIRSYSGDIAGGPFKGLDRANIKARKGDFSAAIAKYRDILGIVRHSAGIKYNIGLGLLKEQPQQAASSFEGSLKDCSNYQPAFQALLACYQTLGEEQKLKDLKQMWDVEEEEEKQEAG